MTPRRRRPALGHRDMGMIWQQIGFCDAGFFVAILPQLLWDVPALHWLLAALILVGIWVPCGWLSCLPFSYWGEYESVGIFDDTGSLGLPPTRTWGDSTHHHHRCLHLCLLHVDPLLTMSYSHHMVKERTAPSWVWDRIWNSFMSVADFFPLDCWILQHFDSTLGFPGEGPRWTIISANVDSFNTNMNCLQWEADVLLMQEARLAESNMIDAQRKAALSNLHVFCSQPLSKICVSSGHYRIPSGGTATCACREITKLFEAMDDASGTWSLLCSTTRVTATWHQVTPTVKVLAFNFYAIANAASERAKFERNNELLHQLFTVAAQFSDIPIVLAGDFQMEPGMYPAVQLALDHWGWADPLLQTDDHGIVTRPPTFFQHAAASDTEGQSSRDGILVNRTALTALIGMEVLQHHDRQHRPIRAVFMWDRIHQTGSVLQKAAKLNLVLIKFQRRILTTLVVLISFQDSSCGTLMNMLTNQLSLQIRNGRFLIPLLFSSYRTMEPFGRRDPVQGGACLDSRLYDSVLSRMIMVAVPLRTFCYYGPFSAHCGNSRFGFIALTVGQVTFEPFATHSIKSFADLKLPTWCLIRFSRSLYTIFLI